jgi:hypothetical protein
MAPEILLIISHSPKVKVLKIREINGGKDRKKKNSGWD